MGQSHRVLCLHPEGERQLMVRGSVTKSPHPAAPGDHAGGSRTRRCAGTPHSRRGSAPGAASLTAKWGKKGEKCWGPAKCAATAPGLCVLVHVSPRPTAMPTLQGKVRQGLALHKSPHSHAGAPTPDTASPPSTAPPSYCPSVRRAASRRPALILQGKGGKLASDAWEPLEPDRKSRARCRKRLKETGESLTRRDGQEPGNMNEAASA